MFEVESSGEHKLVTPTQDINPNNAPQAKEFFRELIEGGSRSIVIDLSRTVRLCGLSPNLQQIFQLTRLTRVFEIFPDRDSALQ